VSLDPRADYRYLDDMATTRQLMDADAFLARPERPFHEELIDGRIVVSEATPRHQLALTQILVAINVWTDGDAGRGAVTPPIDLRISDRTVLAPDVVWYADASRADLDAPAQLRPPDLAAEIRSPSTWRYDVGVKRERYEGWGVGELWLVDGDSRSVLVNRRSRPDAAGFDVALELGEDEVLTSPGLPGFELAVRAIFVVPGEHQK